MPVPVEIREVSLSYGRVLALDRVDLEVRAGELFFLLGPSGCGKTTLLRCLAGFCQPDSGTLRVGGRDVTREPAHRRDMGMVFQSYALWPHMTVFENVAFGLEMRGVPGRERIRRVGEALERVRMGDRATARPAALSGGQQQRVALARALVVEPQCLLLDEPLSNLDAKLRHEMRTEIRRICKESGLTGIYVTHDQKEALAIADRLAVMEGGRIRQTGTPREVYTEPGSRWVATFVGETNLVAGRIVKKGAGVVEVETELGRLVAAGRGSELFVPGDSVCLSVRPEAAQVCVAGRRAVNSLEARLVDCVYLGESVQYVLDMGRGGVAGAGPVWTVLALNPGSVGVGSEAGLSVCFEPADVVVLRGE